MSGIDACRQLPLLVNGAPSPELPQRAADVRLSANGTIGIVETSACSTPGDAFHVLMFWPDDPGKPPVELTTVTADPSSRTIPEHHVEISDDGARLAFVDPGSAAAFVSFDLTAARPKPTPLLPDGCGIPLAPAASTGYFVRDHVVVTLATCAGVPTLLAGEPGAMEVVAKIAGCPMSATLSLHTSAMGDPMHGWIAIHAARQTWTVGDGQVYGPWDTADADVAWAPAA